MTGCLLHIFPAHLALCSITVLLTSTRSLLGLPLRIKPQAVQFSLNFWTFQGLDSYGFVPSKAFTQMASWWCSTRFFYWDAEHWASTCFQNSSGMQGDQLSQLHADCQLLRQHSTNSVFVTKTYKISPRAVFPLVIWFKLLGSFSPIVLTLH